MTAVDAVLLWVLQRDAEFPGGVEEDAHAAHRVVEDGQPHLSHLIRLRKVREQLRVYGFTHGLASNFLLYIFGIKNTSSEANAVMLLIRSCFVIVIHSQSCK